MTAGSQLRLFPAPQPLVKRLGVEWFRSVPRTPGVYRMFDGSGRLLYVGKATDLRARLSSYRRTSGQPRKTIRLVHRVARIEFEPCPDEPSARLRENDLIRTLRPPFNRAGTWPRAALYVRLQLDAAGLLHVECTRTPAEGDFGAFRPGVRLACGALARLAWRLANPGAPLGDMPGRLLSDVGPWMLRHPSTLAWANDLLAFWSGDSPRWITRCLSELPPPTCAFDDAWTTSDLDRLAAFFGTGPARNRWLQTAVGLQRARLLPEELDDLPIVAGRRAAAASSPTPAPAG